MCNTCTCTGSRHRTVLAHQVLLREEISLAEHVAISLTPHGGSHGLKVQLSFLSIILCHLLLLLLVHLAWTDRPALTR